MGESKLDRFSPSIPGLVSLSARWIRNQNHGFISPSSKLSNLHIIKGNALRVNIKHADFLSPNLFSSLFFSCLWPIIKEEF